MDLLSRTVLMGASNVGPTYWIATLGVNADAVGAGCAVSPYGNVYVTGDYFVPSTTTLVAFLAKYTGNGQLLWQRSLSTPNDARAYSVGVDTQEAAGIYGEGNVTSDISFLARYDTSGGLQFQEKFADTSYILPPTVAGGSVNRVAVTPGGDIHTTTTPLPLSPGFSVLYVAKFNSSGVVQWQRELSGASNVAGEGVAVGSVGEVYAVGYADTAGSTRQALLVKYDASGAIQWQRLLGGASGSSTRANGVAVDPLGGVYFVGSVDAFGGDLLVVKYDTSGALQWQRLLAVGYTGFRLGGVATDTLGNAYVSCGTDTGLIAIAKYDAAGTLLWQRQLSGPTFGDFGGIAVDTAGTVYVTGYFEFSGVDLGAVLAKLPSDGSLTGTYGAYVYATSSFATSTPTLSSTTPTLVDAAVTDPTSGAGLTPGTPTLTSTTTPL